MDTIGAEKLRALRRAVLAATDTANAGQVNALLVLGFRKINEHAFTTQYFELSFWPQLAPLLDVSEASGLARQFKALEQ